MRYADPVITFNGALCKIWGIEADYTNKLAIRKDCRRKTLSILTGLHAVLYEPFSTTIGIWMRNITC